MIRSQLKTLGFTEKEIQVYLSLLRVGPSFASTIARISGVKRTSVYDILNNLLERNLIQSIDNKKNILFYVDDIKKILYEEKQKLKVAEEVISLLEKSKIADSPSDVRYYKGVEKYREFYEEILRVKPKEVMTWINLESFYKATNGDREESWTKERVEKKIFARMILQDTPMAHALRKSDKKNYRETRLFPADKPFASSCVFYDNRICFFDTSDEIRVIEIKNPVIYQMQKQIFELNWESLK